MFAALFFVSVGALMDVSQLPFFIVPALIFVATSFAAKFMTVYLSSKSQGLSKKASLQTAFGSSASGGELALVTAKGGADVGATSPFVLPMVGTMTIITSFLSPYVVKFGWKIGERFKEEPVEKSGEQEERTTAQDKGGEPSREEEEQPSGA
jgi:CPA2 family monovalent cation:H+ antiporter-2